MGKKKPPPKPKGNGRPASPKKPTPGCYVLSLTVENIRCFGPKQTLDCSDGEGRPRQWTVILGDNGTGKTTLLRAIAQHCFRGHADLDPFFRLKRFAEPASYSLNCWLGNFTENEHHFTLTTSAVPHMNNGTNYHIWNQTGLDSEHPFWESWQMFGYGSERTRQDGIPARGEDTIDAGVRPLLGDAGLRSSQRWLLDLDYSNLKDGTGTLEERARQVRELLLGVLPDVTDMRFVPDVGVFPRPHVELLTPYGWVPLRQLGHGYQTMIAWVTDFVSRMVERYPESENPLAEPAVCLVDEIDLHLHPVWQRKVIGYLSERFPKTQFIVTAHGPLVVQAAASANANIAVLVRSMEKDADGNHHVEIRNNPEDVRDWRLDQILTSDLFGGIDLRSAETAKLFARKRELLDKAKRAKAEEAELAEIEAKIAGLPVGDSEKFSSDLQLLRNAFDALKTTPQK